MVKVVAFFKRRAGMAVEEFQAYWRTRHPVVVTKLSGVHRYVQSHTRLAAYRNGEPVYDGIAELWFEDTAAMHALRDTPEMAAVQADEARFIERSTMGLIITDEHVVKDGPVPPDAVKSADPWKGKPTVPCSCIGSRARRHRRSSRGAWRGASPGARTSEERAPRLERPRRSRAGHCAPPPRRPNGLAPKATMRTSSHLVLCHSSSPRST